MKKIILISLLVVALTKAYAFDSCDSDDLKATSSAATTSLTTNHLSISDNTPKIVIMLGSFEMFNAADIENLSKAKELACGGKLFVGVFSDDFNDRKKKRKTVVSQDSRLAIVKACTYVDGVFLKESMERVEAYIDRYHADLLVMEDDCFGKFNNIRPVQCIYLPKTSETSTTDTIADTIQPSGKPSDEQSLVRNTGEFVEHRFDKNFPPAMYHDIYEFQRIMDICQIPFFFNRKTLLGAARHGGLPAWEEHADAAILAEHVNMFVQKGLPYLLSKGYAVSYIDSNWKGYQIHPFREQNEWMTYMELSIMDFCTETSEYVSTIKSPALRVRKEQIFPIKKTQFGSTLISVPNDYPSFLETYFGTDWKTHIQACNYRFSVEEEPREANPQDLLPAGPFDVSDEPSFIPLAVNLLRKQKQDLDRLGVFDGGILGLYCGLKRTKELNPFPSLEGKTFAYGSAYNLFPYRDITLGSNGKVEGEQHANETTWKIWNHYLFTYHDSGYVTNVFYLHKKQPTGKLMLVGNFIPDGGTAIHYLVEK